MTTAAGYLSQVPGRRRVPGGVLPAAVILRGGHRARCLLLPRSGVRYLLVLVATPWRALWGCEGREGVAEVVLG